MPLVRFMAGEISLSQSWSDVDGTFTDLYNIIIIVDALSMYKPGIDNRERIVK
jgi:hypothetical protein